MSIGLLVESADAKHSTSAASESEVARNPPRDSQNTPASPRQAISVRVEIGLRSRNRVQPNNVDITIRLVVHTNIAKGTKRVRSDISNKPWKCIAIAKQIIVHNKTVA